MAAPPSSSAPMPIAMSTRGWVTRPTKRRQRGCGASAARSIVIRSSAGRSCVTRWPPVPGPRASSPARAQVLRRRPPRVRAAPRAPARRDPGSPRSRRCRRRGDRTRGPSRCASAGRRGAGRGTAAGEARLRPALPARRSRLRCRRSPRSASQVRTRRRPGRSRAPGGVRESWRTSSTIGVTGVSPSWSETVRARSSASASAFGSNMIVVASKPDAAVSSVPTLKPLAGLTTSSATFAASPATASIGTEPSSTCVALSTATSTRFGFSPPRCPPPAPPPPSSPKRPKPLVRTPAAIRRPRARRSGSEDPSASGGRARRIAPRPLRGGGGTGPARRPRARPRPAPPLPPPLPGVLAASPLPSAAAAACAASSARSARLRPFTQPGALRGPAG